MRKTLKRASEDANSGVINHSFVEKYIDKIYVTPIDETHMEMKIKFFTNETTTKYLENLRVRTGHTIKEMCQPMTHLFLFVNLLHAYIQDNSY